MGRFRALAITTLLLGGTAFAPSAAQAALTLTSATVGGTPQAGAITENFDNLTLGGGGGVLSSGATISFVTNAQAVSGSSSGVYAAPVRSDGQGAVFGSPGNGADTTTYITSGSTGSAVNAVAKLLLPGVSNYFGLLWGSVDTYNTIEFYLNGSLVESFTGSDVATEAGISATGLQTANGTVYANFGGDSFDEVRFKSSNFAFEFDDVAFVPIPGAALLFGSALAGLAWVRRRGQKADAPLAA